MPGFSEQQNRVDSPEASGAFGEFPEYRGADSEKSGECSE